jgi:glycosyltransferase involved in cell wall biosynthesis
MREPIITVVIPARNAGQVIADTLASVRQQTFKDWEAIIVIDDGSTDDTAEIVRQFAKTDPRFLLIHQHQPGIAAARNRAIAEARGEFIAFLDADDVWFPEKLEKQIKLFEPDRRLDVAFTNFHYWDGQKDAEPFYGANRPLPSGNIDERIIYSISRFCPTMSVHLMRKKTLVDAGLFDATELTIEDWDLWLRMAMAGQRIETKIKMRRSQRHRTH